MPDSPGFSYGSDDLAHYTQPLYPLFAPKAVAVIGATEKPGSVGRSVLWNLISSAFGGTVYPVNPKRKSVVGIKAWPSVKDVPEPLDLAVIVTPAATVPGIIGECVDVGVKTAIVISAGFSETGPKGVKLEEELLTAARRGRMRVIGPNCLGVMSPITGLNASFARCMALPGHVAFVSQSGALCTAVLDWSLRANVGFSAFVSIGSMAEVSWGDLIDFFGDDPRTQSIVLYMESIGNARAFLSAAREVALTKPIIVLKSGRHQASAQAAASHTGAMAGQDAVFDAAFRRVGVLRVDSIAELFSMAQILAKQPPPKGPRLSILTNAGGPGVLAADALIQSGGQLAPLPEATRGALDAFLPPAWSRNNPVDILGDAQPERYVRAAETVLGNPESDGLLVVFTPQAMSNPTATAENLRGLLVPEDKPLLTCWMGGAEVLAGRDILDKGGLPTFEYPDLAARAFTLMWEFSRNLRSLYETPSFPEGTDKEATELQNRLARLEQIRASGRTLLTELESKELLSAFGIPTVEPRLAQNAQEAERLAAEIGYPVVMKLNSETLTHKREAGGVKLNLATAEQVRAAWYEIESAVRQHGQPGDFQGVTVQRMAGGAGHELILGSNYDPQFGPVLLFGAGGSLVEVMRDRVLGLPPLNTTLARRLMEHTQIYAALQGAHGLPTADLAQLEQVLVRFSRLISEVPCIKEIDCNPLFAGPDQLTVLDARVVLHAAGETPTPPAIRPYPVQYGGAWTLPDGQPVRIRPIRPDDEPRIVRFHEEISETSVYFYFFHPVKFRQRASHERLTRICFLDYDRQISLVAEVQDRETGGPHILGVVRLIKQHFRNEAEIAMIILDEWQGKGLGTELLSRIIDVARAEGLDRLEADVLPDNHAMRRLCEKFGFTLNRSLDDPMVRAMLTLKNQTAAGDS